VVYTYVELPWSSSSTFFRSKRAWRIRWDNVRCLKPCNKCRTNLESTLGFDPGVSLRGERPILLGHRPFKPLYQTRQIYPIMKNLVVRAYAHVGSLQGQGAREQARVPCICTHAEHAWKSHVMSCVIADGNMFPLLEFRWFRWRCSAGTFCATCIRLPGRILLLTPVNVSC